MTRPTLASPLPQAVDRRTFLRQGAGLGAALGLPLLAACGGGNDDRPLPSAGPSTANTHTRTLFFNLAHEAFKGRPYYLTAGGRRTPLVEVAAAPQVLAQARVGNAFLRAVPDASITHHVESAVFANDAVTLSYVSVDDDVAAGTWTMSSVQLYIPASGATRAFAAMQARAANGLLELSFKRQRYGITTPAASAQDLADERVLLDPHSQAQTMVGNHPDIFSLEPSAAHVVHSTHLESFDSYKLGLQLAQPSYAGATLETTAEVQNPTGWATLRPVLGDDHLPMRNLDGQHKGRILALPIVSDALRPLAAGAMQAAIESARADPALGADVTGRTPSETGNAELAGTLWMRADGRPTIDAAAGRLAAGPAVTMTLKETNAQEGYQLDATSTLVGSTSKVELTVQNWYLNFRGIWLQFLDANGNVLTLASLPEYTGGGIAAGHDNALDTPDRMLLGIVGPTFTLAGVPVAPGIAQPVFSVPAAASSVRLYSSGLSFQGGNAYGDIVIPGAVLTGIFNYGVTALFAAVGTITGISDLLKIVVIPAAQALALELSTLLGAQIPSGGGTLVTQFATAKFWESQGLVFAKTLVNQGLKGVLAKLATYIGVKIGTAIAADSVPIVGQVQQALAIIIAAANLAETTAELCTTPWSYEHELVYTRSLSVNLLKDPGHPSSDPPDPGDDTFPKAANACIVTAMFDNGTPWTQTLDLPTAVATLPPVVFAGVPAGGQVNVSVAFVQRSTVAGAGNVVLGKGTTGLIANAAGQDATITIEELQFPIGPQTRYEHKLKTTLDANGQHVWAAAPAPSAAELCGGAGTVCLYTNITVRQGSASQRGSVGYAWRGQDTDPNAGAGCDASGGQYSTFANLGTDAGNGGRNAQLGYARRGCFPQPGVQVAYSLLGGDAANFYLDTGTGGPGVVRRLQLDPATGLSTPDPTLAWAALNFPSDALLLHPAGHLVSISSGAHRIETLPIPKAGLADAQAQTLLLARPKSGKGTRPGLLDTPVASAITATGTILVLESGNNRLQAFDIGGNAVRYFNRQTTAGSVPYSLTLTQTDPALGWSYLDLAVEFTGFIYVLAWKAATGQYRLDLYHPDQNDGNPIATTLGVNAARLTVDFWRNVYTLNHEVMRLPSGAAAPLTEPSISLWTPCLANQTCTA